MNTQNTIVYNVKYLIISIKHPRVKCKYVKSK